MRKRILVKAYLVDYKRDEYYQFDSMEEYGRWRLTQGEKVAIWFIRDTETNNTDYF